MSIVHIQRTAPGAVSYASSQGAPDNRVAQATQGVFQKVRQNVAWVWNASWSALGHVGGRISFIFFRIFGIIFPSLSPRLESIWLRCMSVWDKFCNQWKETSLRAKNQQLADQNQGLVGRVALLEGELQTLAQQNGQLQKQNGEMATRCIQAEFQEREAQIRAEKLVRENQRLSEELVFAKQMSVHQEGAIQSIQQERSAMIRERGAAIKAQRALFNLTKAQAGDQAHGSTEGQSPHILGLEAQNQLVQRVLARLGDLQLGEKTL